MSKNKENAATNYFQDSVAELKKVTWPSKSKAFRLSLIVLAFCFSAALVIGVVDFLLNEGYGQLLILSQTM
ncbi:MAG: preprotein translocase subunit SecE [Candidatus Altimarinota bacterium]